MIPAFISYCGIGCGLLINLQAQVTRRSRPTLRLLVTMETCGVLASMARETAPPPDSGDSWSPAPPWAMGPVALVRRGCTGPCGYSPLSGEHMQGSSTDSGSRGLGYTVTPKAKQTNPPQAVRPGVTGPARTSLRIANGSPSTADYRVIHSALVKGKLVCPGRRSWHRQGWVLFHAKRRNRLVMVLPESALCRSFLVNSAAIFLLLK